MRVPSHETSSRSPSGKFRTHHGERGGQELRNSLRRSRSCDPVGRHPGHQTRHGVRTRPDRDCEQRARQLVVGQSAPGNGPGLADGVGRERPTQNAARAGRRIHNYQEDADFESAAGGHADRHRAVGDRSGVQRVRHSTLLRFVRRVLRGAGRVVADVEGPSRRKGARHGPLGPRGLGAGLQQEAGAERR